MVVYKDITGYKGMYQIGSDGSVLSLERTYFRSDTGKEVYVAATTLKAVIDTYGYPPCLS